VQLRSESDLKEKVLFEENKAINIRIQSKNEEFTRLSVSFEQIRSESHILKADRDKLMQDAAKMSQNEGILQMKYQLQSKDIERLEVRKDALMRQRSRNILICFRKRQSNKNSS
jgi:hypothetical protein